MLLPVLFVCVTVLGRHVAANGFNYNQYPQAQVNAWTQACRSFQAQAFATQAQQNQFFTNMFPSVQLPPLPFMDLCSQSAFAGAGAGASAGAFSHGSGGVGVTSFNNRFGGDDGGHGGYGGSGGVQGVSISSSSNGYGQGGTTVTHFGNGGASSNYIPHNQQGGISTANRFGGSSGQGVSVSSFGSNNGGGYATATRFGGGSGGGTSHYVSNNGGSVSSYGPNGGSFASASRFGGSNGGGNYGSGGYGGGNGVAVGASVSSSSHGNGGGSVQTSVYKQHY